MDTKSKIRVGIVGVGNWGRYGHLGGMRSVRMHVSMEYFTEFRPADLAWTIWPWRLSKSAARPSI